MLFERLLYIETRECYDTNFVVTNKKVGIMMTLWLQYMTVLIQMNTLNTVRCACHDKNGLMY